MAKSLGATDFGSGGVRARGRLVERSSLRDRTDVFRDRADAGEVLAELLGQEALLDPVLLAVPAGGVPVAAAVARELGWPLEVAVVSKITLPWNTESGYGAVAFDGSVLLNEPLMRHCGLSGDDVARGIETTRRKVERRVQRLRFGRGPLRLAGRTTVLVDDGLASGFTMLAAAAACRAAGAERVVVAVPTGHVQAVERLRSVVDAVVCPNLRGGPSFAVADAYERWSDVPEALAELELERLAAR